MMVVVVVVVVMILKKDSMVVSNHFTTAEIYCISCRFCTAITPWQLM